MWPIQQFIFEETGEADILRFCTPAHGPASPPNARWSEYELRSAEALDTPYVPKNSLKGSEARAKDLYGTAATYYFPTGVSHAILGGILAAFDARDTVLVGRNIHRSVLAALAITGARILWMDPGSLWFQFRAEHLKDAINKSGKISGVVLTNPSYEGHLSDIEGIFEICLSHDIKLLIDESLGSHWMMSPLLPKSAVHVGADLVFHSLHKKVGALVPAALLHVPRRSRLSSSQVERHVDLVRSTSPSNLVLLSTEWAIQSICPNPSHLPDLIQNCRRLTETLVPHQAPDVLSIDIHASDPMVVHLLPRNKDPVSLAEALYEVGLDYEHADRRGIVYFVSPWMDPPNISFLMRILLERLAMPSRGRPCKANPFRYPMPRMALDFWTSIRSERSRVCSLKHALGSVSCTLIADCPPGIPLLSPGEIISESHLEILGERNVEILDRGATR